MCGPVSLLCLWACCCLFLAAVSSEDIVVYGEVGGEVVLKPGATFKPGSTITWKDGDNLAMVWDGKSPEVESFRHFKERGNLNVSSGEMTLIRLNVSDSGRYTPEVNEEAATSVHLKVIYPVSKPNINVSCDAEMTACTLTCIGDTSGAGPPTYAWWSGDTPLDGSTQTRRITKEDSLGLEEFSCVLENPVSEENSEPLPNPFVITPESESGLKISTGLTVLISLLAAVLVTVFIHRWKAGMWFFQKESMPWEADFWRKERPPKDTVGTNGATTRQEKGQTDEETPMT